jgi:hypothetical protein
MVGENPRAKLVFLPIVQPLDLPEKGRTLAFTISSLERSANRAPTRVFKPCPKLRLQPCVDAQVSTREANAVKILA